jgi:hypothetical protein
MQYKKTYSNVRCWGCGRNHHRHALLILSSRWGCGRNHHLRDCPTTSAKARSRLWEEYRNRSTKNINKKDSPSKQHTNDRLPPYTPRSPPNDHTYNATNHCHMANRRSQEDTIPPSHPESSHTPRVTMRNKKENIQGAAFAVRHRANITTTKNNSQTHQDSTKPRIQENLPPVPPSPTGSSTAAPPRT